MKNLKQYLEQNHDSKTKSELVDLLKGIQTLISPDAYAKVSGVSIDELMQLTKSDIIKVVESFSDNYQAEWDTKAVSLSKEVLKTVTDLMKADEQLFSIAGSDNASNADFAAELGSIDFAKIIGGPLNACVTAQTNASMSTVSFIKEVGFDDDDKIRYVDFSHTKVKPNPNFGKTVGTEPGEVPEGTNTTDENLEEDVKLTVPFLSILSIPSLRIETCEINFNVKLNSTYSKDVSSEFGVDASAKGGWGPVKFKVSVSYKRSSATGVKVEKEYSLGVKVVASNSEMPAGLENVLGMLAE